MNQQYNNFQLLHSRMLASQNKDKAHCLSDEHIGERDGR